MIWEKDMEEKQSCNCKQKKYLRPEHGGLCRKKGRK
jgi:hypothetical protein